MGKNPTTNLCESPICENLCKSAGKNPTRQICGQELPDLSAGGYTIDESAITAALQRVYNRMGGKGTLAPELFRETSKAFRQAAASGVGDSGIKPGKDFLSQLGHSADVFSAFKTHSQQSAMVAALKDENGKLRSFSQFRKATEPITGKYNKAWLKTEYRTAVTRAHHAANWQQYQDEKDVLPCLEWIESTAAVPGEDHRIFWGTIQPVDSPFWSQHSPGDRWNCQCSLEQTDKAPTHAVTNNPDGDNPAPGLDGHPAEPQLFSQSHPYYPKSCMACPFVSNKLSALYHNLADNRDCNNCKAVTSAIDKTQKSEIIAQNKAQYEVLKKDPNYKDVSFNEKTGGLKASHIEHNFDKKGGKYELNIQEAGYKAGNSVIFGSEKFELENQRFTEGLWNGLPFEVAGRETATENNVLKGLKHCAAKRATKIAVLDFPNGGFDNEILSKAVSRYKGLEKLKDSQYVKFEKIICVQNRKIIYEEPF